MLWLAERCLLLPLIEATRGLQNICKAQDLRDLRCRMQKFKCKGQEKIGGRNHPLKVLPMQGRRGEKIAARTERTTRKPRMGHAMATAGRGPRLLRKGSLLRPGSLLKVCLSSCGAKLALAGCYVVWRHSTHFLRQLGDGDKAQDSAALVYNWQTKKFSLYKTCTLSVSYTHVAH